MISPNYAYKWKTIRAVIHFSFYIKSIPFILFLTAEKAGFEAKLHLPSDILQVHL